MFSLCKIFQSWCICGHLSPDRFWWVQDSWTRLSENPDKGKNPQMYVISIHFFYRRTSSIKSMLQALNWKTLQERIAQCKVIMFYRVVHKWIAVPTTNLQPVISTVRGHNERFLIPFARTQVYRHSFFPDTIRIWNGLPQHILSKLHNLWIIQKVCASDQASIDVQPCFYRNLKKKNHRFHCR